VLFFFCFYNRNKKKRVIRVIFWLVLINFFTILFQYYLASKNYKNVGLTDIYILIETLFLITFFYKTLELNKYKSYFLLLGVLYFLFWGFLNFRIHFNSIEPFSFVLEVIIVMVLSTIFFYQQTKNPKTLFVYESSMFWIIIGYFIYLSGTLFLFLYWSKLSKADQIRYFYLNDLFSVIRSVLLSIAMIIKEKKDEPPVNNYPMQYTL
jgi:hypothetical protein